ncbi:exodeoxyribonuclease V subunit gamma [Actinomycetospora sp. OC33-EN08]|uniref:RecBCD enzyme subunit RecC n=1 Tax=Actinomycetospora aurantiaca TaxID=3129233 RepID=A0ABU8MU38_9PSEU
MALQVHRAERADTLAEALADVLAEPPDDPFTPDVVAVPTRGVERWLAQRLSHHLGARAGDDGVCANVVFPPPAELVRTARHLPDDELWAPDRLVWPLLETIDACAGEAWLAPLNTYLGVLGDTAGTRAGRRFAAARHLARLFDAYAEHRPAMVRAWAAKDDEDVPADLAWQPELWRRLRDRLGVPGPAETLPDVPARAPAADLPARVSVFGPTRLSTTELAVLEALAADREVHLWLPHPSPALWESVRGTGHGAGRRRDDPTADTAAHPLLRSLARDARELQLRLPPGAAEEYHPAPGPAPATLLGRLQDDLAHDRAPAGVDLPPDGSVVVHSCHGPDRQVEVLREAVLGLLVDDPTLEPRDIVVMCPDVETFAPLVTAAFGGSAEDGGHPGHRLQVRVADRSLTQVNPVLGVLGTVLDLADARLTASELLDLAESEPVRRRFSLDDDACERLRVLVGRAGVRWGLDREHRAEYKLGRVGENTWEAGLDRLLVGVAMSGDEQVWLDSALPLDEVDSRDADLVGRLAEFVDRVADVLGRLRGEQPLGAWLDALTLALDALTATVPADVWQLTQARAVLAEVRGSAGSSGAADPPPLTLHDVRAVLSDHLAGRPTRANFRTGTLTVATLLPMRSVPHRVVCLLGLDDQVFPRDTRTDGDDVLAREPRVGERDAAAEDRQLLLDAVMAATERLVVVHSGADERTGAPRPPAVPVGELLDTLDATATVGGRPAREHVVRRHPLHPFAPANFRTTGPGARPFSFDATACDGARALVSGRTAAPVFLESRLPARPAAEVDLADLVRFVEHPVRAFLRQRLALVAHGEEEEPDEALPVEPDSLARWAIGERLLADRLAGHDVTACMEAERRRGSLPPGRLGVRLLRSVGRQAEELRRAAEPLWAEPARDLTVSVRLDDGTLVVGTVPGVRGSTLAAVSFSRLAPKHRAAAWVQLVALAAAHPDRSFSATTIGKGGQDSPTARATITGLDPVYARAVLADLVALHAEGMREPLPLFAKCSERYVGERGRRTTKQAFDTARREWSGRFGEAGDPAHVLVWGPDRPLDDVAGPAGAVESTRFGELAVRFWKPLREAERGREEHYR